MQTSAPAREIWQPFLTCAMSPEAAGLVQLVSLCGCVGAWPPTHGCTPTHINSTIMYVLDFIFMAQPGFLGNVPVYLHSRELQTPGLFGSVRGVDGWTWGGGVE